jgi:hypothetical protein
MVMQQALSGFVSFMKLCLFNATSFGGFGLFDEPSHLFDIFPMVLRKTLLFFFN